MPNYDKEIELLAMNPHEFSPVVITGDSGNGKTDFLLSSQPSSQAVCTYILIVLMKIRSLLFSHINSLSTIYSLMKMRFYGLHSKILHHLRQLRAS